MTPILLIAGNFLREQRWPLLLLILWVLVSATVANIGGLAEEDVLFFLKQQAVYGVVFAGFLAGSAIHNERRSRRILAVLSKGISRREYLAGLLGGVITAVALYCTSIAIAGGWMLLRLEMREEQLGLLIATLMAACVLTAAVGIFFGTFLTPLLATAATALALGLPVILVHAFGSQWRDLLPVYGLMRAIISSPDQLGDWSMALWAIGDAVLLWLAASVTFGRKDIAVAVE